MKQMMSDSQMMVRMILARLHPIAIRMPISFVLSETAMTRVFITTMQLLMSAMMEMAQAAVSTVCIRRDLPDEVAAAHDRQPRQAGLDPVRGVFDGDTPLSGG